MRYLIILSILITGCSWSARDRGLMVAYTALNAIDMMQTQEIFNDDRYHELNPMLTENNFIPIMIGTNLLLYWVADMFPKLRPYLLFGGVGLKGGMVIHNKRIGL